MTAEEWQRVKEIFTAARDLDPAERQIFLSSTRGESAAVRAEVESLLVSSDAACDFLEQPALEENQEMPELAGQRIGPYRLVREIGHGGMGTVYEAVRADEEFEQRVAIKLVRFGIAGEFLLTRFRNERQILAGFNHPNIARLLDGGTTNDGRPYLVMEFVEGMPLTEWCDAKRLGVRQRVDLFRVICGAVHAAHKNLIVHRDLKPGNILVTADGAPKLLDFGIAKALDAGAESSETTSAFLMTPDYASPEQVRGEPITTASDVYSLGVILYELLSGTRPYRTTGIPATEAVRKICETNPRKPSAAASDAAPAEARGVTPDRLRRTLAGDLDNIVLKALRKEPERRYGSAEQFSDDLGRYLNGLPVTARADTARYRSAKFIQRNKVAVAAAALILLLLVGGLAATLWQMQIAGHERAKAERRFQDVRKLANSLVFEIHDSIRDLPGSTGARQLIVTKALQYLDSLSREAGDDPGLQRELAAAYTRVGDVQGNPVTASLGDTNGALASYRKALAIQESLGAGDAAAEREMGATFLKIGMCQDALGDFASAAKSLQRALALNEKSAAGTRDPKTLDALAENYRRTGWDMTETGDADGGIVKLRRSIGIREAIRTDDPALARQIRMHLAASYGSLAFAQEMKGNLAEAVETQERVAGILDAESRVNPNDASGRRGLGEALYYLGLWQGESGDGKRSLATFERTREVFAALSRADPKDEFSRRFTGFSETGVAKALTQLNRPLESIPHLRRALAIFKSLPDQGGKAQYTLSGFADTYSGLGDANARLARFEQARAWYRKSLDIWVEMSRRGALAMSDRKKPVRLREAIAHCDAALAKRPARPISSTGRSPTFP